MVRPLGYPTNQGRSVEPDSSRCRGPFYCSARLLTDGVLPFREIRDTLATAYEISLLKEMPDTVLGNFRM